MADAHLAIVLHAHLPYIHHPEHEQFLEEDWLYEAIVETYVPLLLSWERLREDGVPFRVTMSLTPTLLEMLANPLLRKRCMRYLERRIELSDKEARNVERSSPERAVAQHYLERFRQVKKWITKHHGNVTQGFKNLQETGHVEVMACAATHGFLPLMLTPNAIRAQIEIGIQTVERHLGKHPRGIWLPECAWRPGMDEVLAEQGVEYFLVDAHGILNGHPHSPSGVHAPMLCPSGVAAFGRDLESSKQVWSSDEGYPGDGLYREFYRDLGYDAAYDYIEPYLHDDGIRRNLGLKYHRVTGKVPLHEKAIYDRRAAVNKAREHGAHFIFCRQHQFRFLKSHLAEAPIAVAPYDAELFGHWWYEGPEFLEQVFRAAQFARNDFCVSTLSEYLDQHSPQYVGTPGSSSWGDKGYFEVWLNGANDWIYRHLHHAEEQMVEMARRHEKAKLSAKMRSALNQATRELLLAQSSDWAFLMTMGSAVPYAEKRTRNHLNNFQRLHRMIAAGNVRQDFVTRCLRMNPIFPDIDFRCYS